MEGKQSTGTKEVSEISVPIVHVLSFYLKEDVLLRIADRNDI